MTFYMTKITLKNSTRPLVHLTLNDAFKTRKHLQMAGYMNFEKIIKTQKISSDCLTASLPDHIHEP